MRDQTLPGFASSDADGGAKVDAHTASFRDLGAKGLRHVGDAVMGREGEDEVEEEDGEALIVHVLSAQGLPLFAPEVGRKGARVCDSDGSRGVF